MTNENDDKLQKILQDVESQNLDKVGQLNYIRTNYPDSYAELTQEIHITQPGNLNFW